MYLVELHIDPFGKFHLNIVIQVHLQVHTLTEQHWLILVFLSSHLWNKYTMCMTIYHLSIHDAERKFQMTYILEKYQLP